MQPVVVVGLFAWVALSGALSRPTVGHLVLHDPQLPIHRAFGTALLERDPTVTLATIHDPPRAQMPRTITAVGDEAASIARTLWSTRPLASILVWTEPAQPPAAQELVISAHPGTICTAAILKDLGPTRQWIVLSSDQDPSGEILANRIEGTWITGSPRELSIALRTANLGPERALWLRADPQLGNIRWLKHLAWVGHVTGTYVGSDVPGLRALGFADPVALDIDRLADTVAAWATKVPRRSKIKRRHAEATCLH